MCTELKSLTGPVYKENQNPSSIHIPSSSILITCPDSSTLNIDASVLHFHELVFYLQPHSEAPDRSNLVVDVGAATVPQIGTTWVADILEDRVLAINFADQN